MVFKSLSFWCCDGFVVSLDTSGDWRFIAVVVFRSFLPLDLGRHIASVDRRRRWRIIGRALDLIDKYGYGLCIRSDVVHRVRALTYERVKKGDAWRIAVREELLRIANHLGDKGF